MNSFTLKSSGKFEENHANADLFLWILNVHQKPPHIGISFGGKYFSLKVNGIDFMSSKEMYAILKRKKIPSAFIQLKNKNLDAKKFEELKILYTKIGQKAPTCLYPIFDFLSIENNKMLLPDFLNFLEEKNEINTILELNIPKTFDYTIAYNTNDVVNYISRLKDVKRTANLP